MDTPMTVAELIKKLEEFDPDALVWLECTDDYYSGPLDEIARGTAVLGGAHERTERSAAGQPRIVKCDPSWFALKEGETVPDGFPVLSTRPCILIRVT